MKPTDEQELIGQLTTEGNDIIVIAGAGCGKEQPISSIIKTPAGDRLLGGLVIGDRVLGRDGKPCTVLDITYQGVKDVYEVTFRDGSKTRCGLNHNWSVLYNYAPRAKFTVKTTEQLLKAGLRKSNGDYKYQIPVCSAVQYENTVKLPLHPYILGVFLGDGSYQNSTACLSCHKEDVGILHKVQQLFKEHHEIDLLLNLRATSENGLQTTLVICSDNSKNPITALLDVLNLKRNKHIPDVYMLGTVEQRLDLLRGLMDTDGSCSKNRTVFCNTNRAIIERVVELVQSLGGTAIETEADTRKETDCFRLNIKLPINPFLLERKAANWSYSWKNPPSRYIFSIEKLNYQEEQRCLTVSAEDSLYLTDNFIVTHNSSTLRLQAEQLLPLGKNLLVLTFNSANAEETREHPDRPANLFACTVHSLAYRALGLRKTANYLAWEDIPMEKLTELSKELAASPKEQKTVLTLLRNGVTKSVVNFCQGGSRAIADKLTSYLGWYFQSEDVNLSVTEEQVDTVASIVLEYWAWLSKDSNREKWTPDVYLKVFQLTRPKLKQVFDATSRDWVDVHAVALDECLTASQTVKTSKGLYRIKRLYDLWAKGEELPEILSYNIEKEVYEYKPMLSALKSEERDTLLIKTEGLNKIECTPNHRILTQRGYVPAGELVIGCDYLLIDEPTNQKAKLVLNEDQYQIMLGSFLGDGSLEKRSDYGTYRLKFTHGEKQLEYLKMKATCFCIATIGNGFSGYTGEKSIYVAQSATFLLDKPIWECVKDMDARALAIWYMDDGYYSKSKIITISSNSFTYEEHLMLLAVLHKNFNLNPLITTDRRYFKLSFSVKDSNKLLELTKDFIHPDLGYKNALADTQYNWSSAFKPYAGNFVTSVEYIGKHTVYDIEVEDNHNFITTRSIDNQTPGSGIIVHNCQDTNGVTEAIFSYQTHLQRFIVGDPNQQLYRWRQAGKAMDNFPTFTPAFLSTSFRFNSEIARMANIVLKMNNSPFMLTGSGTKTTIDTKAILCRTNAAVIQYLFGYAMQGKERIYCSLNLKQTFNKLYHINSCYFNEAPKYPNSELLKIKDRQSLEEAIAHSEELQRLVKLNLALTKQAGSLSKAKALIEKVLVSSMGEASLCISTVHGFKGLEVDEVTLAEDFIKIPEDEPVNVVDVLAGDVDLRCCLYVAISRARVKFNPPWYLKELLSCN